MFLNHFCDLMTWKDVLEMDLVVSCGALWGRGMRVSQTHRANEVKFHYEEQMGGRAPSYSSEDWCVQ